MSLHFTILSFIALVCFVIFMFCAGWPTTFLTLTWAFWLGAALFAWFLDAHVAVSRRPQ